MMCGMACTWIGVGVVSVVFSRALMILGERPRSAKVVMLYLSDRRHQAAGMGFGPQDAAGMRAGHGVWPWHPCVKVGTW